jgi:hypothetical protein
MPCGRSPAFLCAADGKRKGCKGAEQSIVLSKTKNLFSSVIDRLSRGVKSANIVAPERAPAAARFCANPV